jgi:hypothetical protein
MAKNRKYQSAAIRFGPALKALLLCVVIGGSGVGYVWQKNQIYELDQQKGEREGQLSRLEKQNDKLRSQLAVLCSSQYLEKRVKELNLGLVQPNPAQIWPMTEPGPMTNEPDRRLAAQQSPAPKKTRIE